MTNVMQGVEAIPVHVANAHELGQSRPAASCPSCGWQGNPRRSTQFKTLLVSTGASNQDNVQELLPEDPARCYAIIESLDHPVIVTHSKSQAQAGTNLTDTNYATPDGKVIPNAASGGGTAWVVIHGQNRMFVSTPQSTSCRVTVQTCIHQP